MPYIVASVAQTDVCLTDDQEVVGSIPTIKYFLWSFSLFL